MLKIKIVAAYEDTIRLEIGPEDQENPGQMVWGQTAEVSVDRKYGSDEPRVEVSMAAVGSRPIDVYEERVHVLQRAIGIARQFERMLEHYPDHSEQNGADLRPLVQTGFRPWKADEEIVRGA